MARTSSDPESRSPPSASQVCATATAGKRTDPIGNPDLLRTHGYTGQVWHLPGPVTVTSREILDTSEYSSTFGLTGTPLARAVADTLEWGRMRQPSYEQTTPR